jgi:hypothetical protein
VIYIGVDPGLSGAIAILRPESARVLDLPTTPLLGNGTVTKRVHAPPLMRIVQDHASGGRVVAVVEDLTVGGQGSSQQTVGSQYRTRGTVEATLELLGLQVEAVYAQRWKKFYGLSKVKKDALGIARALYPELEDDLRLVANHNRAEAVLIAHWARKVLGGGTF